MAVIIQTIFSSVFSLMNISISIRISLNFVFKGPIDNIPVQIMVWQQAIIWTNDG